MNKALFVLMGGLLLGVLAFAQASGGATQSPTIVQEVQVPPSALSVTASQAIQLAQQYLGTQAVPTRVVLADEHGHIVWEVIFGEQEVKVDAQTAQIVHEATYEPTKSVDKEDVQNEESSVQQDRQDHHGDQGDQGDQQDH